MNGLGKLTTLQTNDKAIDKVSSEPEDAADEIKDKTSIRAEGLGKLDIRNGKLKSVGGVRG